MNTEARITALSWLVKQLAMARAKTPDPAVAVEFAQEEMRYRAELAELAEAQSLTNQVSDEDDEPRAVNFSKQKGEQKEGGK